MTNNSMHNGSALLRVCDLKTHFHTDQGVARAVDGISFDLPAGKTLALVGESGCGKSVTALSILRLIPSPPGVISGEGVFFENQNLLALSEREMRNIRGNDISMIFQEPMTSMNPVFRVGRQIAAVLRLHQRLSESEARKETLAMLDRVGIPAAERRMDDYPHQMSGGMLQRVMIAMALACRPKILIADEPTTALDVTIQAQILDLLKTLQHETGMSVLLITHDLGIVAETADEVVVMYAGKIAEKASVKSLFAAPQHPYTKGLFASLPALQRGKDRLYTIRGTVPAPTVFPGGCRFHPRCPYALTCCANEAPPFVETIPGHYAACWLHDPKTMHALGKPAGIPKETCA
ncbi:MAG TPA: ABC transporter ATP-binding protein [Candidatus Hydrogenedentes bacterium]|nr:ABC transporter ATP-binding protein [Candidatus Hydrogenedentota bacterium]